MSNSIQHNIAAGIKLNLGAGKSKIEGYINIDVNPSCKPDIVCNFISKQLPYRDNTVTEIVLFHTIEHIYKRFHKRILVECWRVLKPGGRIIISYPEFLKCVNCWKKNHKGMKEFFEATVYGRHLYAGDSHVTIMHTEDFLPLLYECGFKLVKNKPEPSNFWNTIITAVKSSKRIDYEALVKDHISNIKFMRVRATRKLK